ncbi:dynamin family protein [Metabacillus sp. GX 13764]|uniref:dynamin family protein n=1 Tax=Metabacillus kandeliae TaxID=2900151 RepID=UPI001E41E353|nr:dynamin family protein [Metabacillus kandeliae]MCD7033429.1 dynamin family protein [Metabacillus kandeliae]
MQAVNSYETEAARLIALYEAMDLYDTKTALKVAGLIQKVVSGEKHIAFTGHFSAGKSSMINALLGENILPASPIPTSANLVLLQKGEKRVELTMRDGSIAELQGSSYSSEKVQQYCKEGQDIERVHIWDEHFQLPEHAVILDTPGIDSTDEAHMASTESIIHSADLIFYVTDYNHVQSEMSLNFVKHLAEREMNVCLIVNQIDKHREEEIPFEVFKEKISSSFEEIGLHRGNIYYTSLKKGHQAHNQLSEVRQLIQSAMKEKNEPESAKVQLPYLVKEHLHILEQEKEIQLAEEQDLYKEAEELTAEKESLLAEMKESDRELEQLLLQGKDSIRDLLKNANLTPFEVREKAALYLESQQSGFKAGFLFSKGKTIAEKEKREQELTEALQEKLASQIDWHLIELLKKIHASFKGAEQALIGEIQAYSTDGVQKAMKDCVKKGAAYNPDYVLNYSKEIGDTLKRNAQHQALDLLEKITAGEEKKRRQKQKQLQAAIAAAEEKLAAAEEKITRIEWLKHHQKDLMSLLKQKEGFGISASEWVKQSVLFDKNTISEQELTSRFEDKPKFGKDNAVHSKKEEKTEEIHSAKAAEVLGKTAGLLKGTPGFQHFVKSAEDKAARLTNRQFTIALFGAFSAGKSSFANALLGKELLPSSPAPTTAAINRIKPVEEGKPHGYAEIKMKNEEQVLADLNSIMSGLKESGSSLDEALEKAERLAEKQGLDESVRVQLSLYCKVLKESSKKSSLGQTIQSDAEHFKPYISVEEKACLVEEAIIYYDCPLTRKGITLVDTPGADSLHKRHTEVAFKFIKDADAILFVTYYNHPFSRGDREFLHQLGRVKDAFSLDKMFFIINAADLAKDAEELSLVKEYIEGQLLEHQIRFPRMYGVSSLNEIKGHQTETSKDFERLNRDLTEFIEHGLVETTIQASLEELRSIKRQLGGFIEEMNQDEAGKEKKIAALHKAKKDAAEAVEAKQEEQDFQFVRQEIKEQLYFVRQRLELQFSDFFKEAFHPGAFYSQQNVKEALRACMAELLGSMEFRLHQELQAVTLRIENKFNESLLGMRTNLIEELLGIQPNFAFSSAEAVRLSTPEIPEVIKKLQPDDFQKELSIFKNAKAFFEKDEKAKMKDALLTRLSAGMETGLELAGGKFDSYYREHFKQNHSHTLEAVHEEADSYFQAVFSMYQTGEEKEKMQELLKKISLLAGELGI